MNRPLRAAIACALGLAIFAPVHSYAVVATNPTPDCSAGSTCTIVFPFVSDYYAWTVPAGVTSVTVDISGAAGSPSRISAVAGKGGRVQATLTTTPAQILYMYPGGEGGLGSTSAAGTGGWNGGGAGGYYGSSNYGAGGGGASDIRTSVGTLSSRLVVAGGGGGAACNYCSTPNDDGANGGGLVGADSYMAASGSAKAMGGSQSAGGSGNQWGSWNASTSGSSGVGGAGAIGTGGGGGGGGYFGGGGGSWTSGGGGSSYTDAIKASSVTHTQGYKSGNGTISVTYLNAPTPTSFASSQSTPTNTLSSISYSITFSQIVNSVANSDFSNAGTATGCTFSINASSGSTLNLTISSCGQGTLIPQVLANSVYGTVTNTNGPASNTQSSTPITIDRDGPTITNVTPSINSTYRPGEVVTLTTYFSESITVIGNPRMQLTVGTLTRYAVFYALIDSKTASFRYSVTTSVGEFDTDGISISTTLDLNGGSVSDLATNALTPLTFTAPNLTGVLVAQAPSAPTIDSITATNGTLTVYFTAGSNNGSPLTSYHFSTDNGATWKNRITGTTESPIIISVLSSSSSNLTNGVSYPIRIRTVNSVGSGDSSTAVAASPTSISVTGDATLTLTYGTSASSGAYSATGGTNTYTWSLGSSLTGITLSGTTVTASSSTPAGTYTQTIRATDGNTQVGTKTLTITVNKASTSITISLPNSSSNAALGGAVTITATVPRAGAVDFKLGGSTISGCGSATAATTSATCSWTPNALGSVSLTAVFTPTDSSNYETSTTTTLSITVVNGVSSVTLSLTGGTTTPPKGQAINIIAAVDQAGRVTFFVDGKRVPGCINRATSVGNINCSWKPAVQKAVTISARLTPTNNVYNASTSSMNVQVVRRSGAR